MDDDRLVERARRGDSRAFAALASKHRRSLYCTAYSILGSSWDASDAVQEALLEGWARVDALRDPAHFKPWLARILVNTCFDALGRRSRVILSGDAPPEDPRRADAHTFVGSETQLDLLRAIRGLEKDQRMVVALRFFNDLKIDDIAAMLDVPAGTVKSRINRALARLAQDLGRPAPLEVGS